MGWVFTKPNLLCLDSCKNSSCTWDFLYHREFCKTLLLPNETSIFSLPCCNYMHFTSTPWLRCFNFVIIHRESLVLYLLTKNKCMHSKIKYLLSKEPSQVVVSACLHYVWKIKCTLYNNSASIIKDYAWQGKSDPVQEEKNHTPSSWNFSSYCNKLESYLI